MLPPTVTAVCAIAVLLFAPGLVEAVQSPTPVPLHRIFEFAITNSGTRTANRFVGVTLNTTFRSPTGNMVAFWGFFDGGDTWRQRFMPSEVGSYAYNWSFSDGSLAGEGTFDCVAAGGGPGILTAYKANPRWFAYNGDMPVFIKSYYNKAGGLTRQQPAWAAANFYSKLTSRGYNHHMSSGFMPVLPLTALWDGQPFADGPPAINATVYTDRASPSTSMRLDVWRSMEGHLGFLNDHDVAADFFQGFDAKGPGSEGGLQWAAMNASSQRWWVSYAVARLAPFANIAGFAFAWESPGNDTDTDLGLARLLRAADPFGHLVTYEEENCTTKNHFALPEWGFASVEALGDEATANWTRGGGYSTQNHHDVSLQGYRGKPVLMCEGHDLWRSWWHAQEPNVVRAAWAVTTAGASFTWADMGHYPDDPYASGQALATYPAAALAVDVLARIMTEVLPAFHRMVPADALLSGVTSGPGAGGGKPKHRPAPPLTFCLAEQGAQYLVYSDAGRPFSLDTAACSNCTVTWFDPVSGAQQTGGKREGGDGVLQLSPPTAGRHWVAVLLAGRAHSALD